MTSVTSISPHPRAYLALSILLIGCLAYANSLHGPLIYDDQAYIIENESIRQLWPPTWMGEPMAHRPVGAFTLALNYAMGGLDVVGYHLMNIAIHLACACVTFGVLRVALSRSSALRASNGWLPLSVALLWLLHPLASECVNYLSQRTESLMALFYLLVVYCTMRYAESGVRWWCWSAVVCCALGMATKETMATAPLVALLFDRTFMAPSFVAALRRRAWHYGGLASTWLLLARALWSRPHGETIGFDLGVSPWVYALNQCEMIGIYLSRSLWPHPLLLDYGFPQQLTLADVWLEAAIIVGLLALTIVALFRWPSWGVLGAWFFLLLAPTSSFIPIVTEVGAERRMYLPLLSVITLVIVVGYLLLQRSSKLLASSTGPALVVGAAVTLGWLTIDRNQDYQSAVDIWRTVVEVTPDNARGHLSLGAVLEQRGEVQTSMRHYRLAVALRPEYGDAHANLGAALGVSGQFTQSVHHLRIAVSRRPDHGVAQHNLGLALHSLGQVDEAITHYRRALDIDANFAGAHHALGTALATRGEYDDAVFHLRRALLLDPDNEESRRKLRAAQELTRKGAVQ